MPAFVGEGLASKVRPCSIQRDGGLNVAVSIVSKVTKNLLQVQASDYRKQLSESERPIKFKKSPFAN